MYYSAWVTIIYAILFYCIINNVIIYVMKDKAKNKLETVGIVLLILAGISAVCICITIGMHLTYHTATTRLLGEIALTTFSLSVVGALGCMTIAFD